VEEKKPEEKTEEPQPI